jgi:methyl-accepting chemotaxis protein
MSAAIIHDAGNALSVMATGDLTTKTATDYPGKFGNVMRDINKLRDSLSRLISELQDAIHITASAAEEISATTLH